MRCALFDISWSSTAASLYLVLAALLYSPLAVHRNHWGVCCAFFPSSFISGGGEGWRSRGWKVSSKAKEEGSEKNNWESVKEKQ